MLGGGRLTSHYLSAFESSNQGMVPATAAELITPEERAAMRIQSMARGAGNLFFQHKGRRYMNVLMNFVRSGAQWWVDWLWSLQWAVLAMNINAQTKWNRPIIMHNHWGSWIAGISQISISSQCIHDIHFSKLSSKFQHLSLVTRLLGVRWSLTHNSCLTGRHARKKVKTAPKKVKQAR